MNTKTLIFFCSDYPFGKGEVFVENEMHYLEKAFDKIIIITSATKQKTNRFIPKNAEVIAYSDKLSSFQKLLSFKYSFTSIFWQEIFFIKRNLKLKITKSILSILLIDLIRSEILRNYLIKLKNNLSNKDLYFYSYWNDYKAIALARLNRQDGIKRCVKAHGWDIYMDRNKDNYLPLKQFIFKNLDVNYFISQNGLATAEKYIGKKNFEKFKVSYLGTFNNFEPVINILDQNYLNIVSCSNILKLKRINKIIDILSQIENIDVRWRHLGDGALKEEVVAYAKDKLSGKKNIDYFFEGWVDNNAIMQFYNDRNIDLFINVSDSEGLPVSIMEAMSFGIPTIATNVGGTAEIVKDNFNGFLINENFDCKQVAQIIENYYKLQLEEKSKYRKNAYDTWQRNFNADINYKKFVEEVIG